MSAVCVVMRAHNDMPLVAETLRRLQTQRHPFRLVAFDNASTDGTLEEIRKYTDRIHHVPAGAYVPGRVLNQAMAATDGEFVVFLNSDCTPQDDSMLDALLAGFADEKVAAVFGRQMSRPGCRPLMAKDTEDTYGDGSRQALVAALFFDGGVGDPAVGVGADAIPGGSAILRGHRLDVARAPVRIRDPLRCRRARDPLAQLHAAPVLPASFWRGRAEAHIFEWSPWERSLVRYSLLPYASAGGERLEILRRQFAGGIGAVFAGAADGADGGPAARIFEFVARVETHVGGSQTDGG